MGTPFDIHYKSEEIMRNSGSLRVSGSDEEVTKEARAIKTHGMLVLNPTNHQITKSEVNRIQLNPTNTFTHTDTFQNL